MTQRNTAWLGIALKSSQPCRSDCSRSDGVMLRTTGRLVAAPTRMCEEAIAFLPVCAVCSTSVYCFLFPRLVFNSKTCFQFKDANRGRTPRSVGVGSTPHIMAVPPPLRHETTLAAL